MSGHLKEVAVEVAKSWGLTDVEYEEKGAFKETFRANKADFGYVALKVMDPSKCNLCRTDREIEAMQRCSSPRVAQLLGHGMVEHEGLKYLYCIEEYMDGGTLTKKFGDVPFDPEVIRRCGAVLSEAIVHLKDLNLVHRDIKPDNIMFRKDSDDPLLVDFGLVRDLSQTSLTASYFASGPCTPFFAAPEQLNNEKQLIGWRTDQFGLGVALGFCLTGKHPFQEGSMTEPEAIEAVASWQTCSGEFNDTAIGANLGCLGKMLEPWPVRRYSDPGEFLKAFEG